MLYKDIIDIAGNTKFRRRVWGDRSFARLVRGQVVLYGEAARKAVQTKVFLSFDDTYAEDWELYA